MKRLLSHKHPDFNLIFSSISVMTLSHKTVRILHFFCTSVWSYKIDHVLFSRVHWFQSYWGNWLYILTLCCMTLEINPPLQARQGLVRAMFFITIAHLKTRLSLPVLHQLSTNCPGQLCGQLIFTWRVRLCQHFSHCALVSITDDNVGDVAAQEALVSVVGPSVKWLAAQACFA